MWKIWFRYIKGGKVVSEGQSYKGYERKCDATRVAKKQFTDLSAETTCEWVVAKENPWASDTSHPEAERSLTFAFE